MMTIQDLKSTVPAVFAKSASPNVSNKYLGIQWFRQSYQTPTTQPVGCQYRQVYFAWYVAMD